MPEDKIAKRTNTYSRQLTDREIEQGAHRTFVGGMWDEIGKLQFEFLVARNLKPYSKFLDVGCGALRGGIHFMRYLDRGNYHGLDINASLVRAGLHEMEKVGLSGQQPNLLVNNKFDFGLFRTKFDYALAQSLFTHLPMNTIVRCLCEIGKVLGPDGHFFATFFEAPTAAHLLPIKHSPGGITTKYDEDPFHYSFSEIKVLSDLAGLSVDLVGDWQHPRDQRMLVFSH